MVLPLAQHPVWSKASQNRIETKFDSICHQDDPVPWLSDKAQLCLVSESYSRQLQRAQRNINDNLRVPRTLHLSAAQQRLEDYSQIAIIEAAMRDNQEASANMPELVPPGRILQLRGSAFSTSPNMVHLVHAATTDNLPLKPSISYGTWAQNQGTAHSMSTYAILINSASRKFDDN